MFGSSIIYSCDAECMDVVLLPLPFLRLYKLFIMVLVIDADATNLLYFVIDICGLKSDLFPHGELRS